MLGVPIFALITEIVGMVTGERKYDELAREFTKLLAMAYTMTAVLGSVLLVLFVVLYPRFTAYMSGLFKPTWALYIVLILRPVLPGRQLHLADGADGLHPLRYPAVLAHLWPRGR